MDSLEEALHLPFLAVLQYRSRDSSDVPGILSSLPKHFVGSLKIIGQEKEG